MGRRRIRPPRGPEHGVARGWRQRAVMEALLAGDAVTITTHPAARRPTAPSGITETAWRGFRERLANAGFVLQYDQERFGHWRYTLASTHKNGGSEDG